MKLDYRTLWEKLKDETISLLSSKHQEDVSLGLKLKNVIDKFEKDNTPKYDYYGA